MTLKIEPIGLATALARPYVEAGTAPISTDLEGNQRITSRDVPKRGRYSLSTLTGVYSGLAAGSELFQMRWTNPQFMMLIWRVSVSVAASVAASSAGQVDRQLVISRGWTASGSGGTPLTQFPQLRNSFPASLVGDCRVATTAALGTGTKTLDANGVGIAAGTMGASAAGALGTVVAKVPLFDATSGTNTYPLIIGVNEGISVRMVTAEPSGASLITYVDVDWSEVPVTGY